MNAYVIAIFAFFTIWTVLLGLLFYLCLKAVRWLKRQTLSAADARGRDSLPPVSASLVNGESVAGAPANVSADPDMVMINEKLDTEQAIRSATRKEDVRVVSGNLCAEKNIVGDDQNVINDLKRFKKS